MKNRKSYNILWEVEFTLAHPRNQGRKIKTKGVHTSSP
jgi:hypothetical protein